MMVFEIKWAERVYLDDGGYFNMLAVLGTTLYKMEVNKFYWTSS